MAEESKLGFDANDVLRTLQLLDKGFKDYAQRLTESSSATDKFNSTQSAIEKALASQATALTSTVKELLSYAAAMKKADDQAKKSNAIAQTAAKLDARRNAIAASKSVTSQLNVDRGSASIPQLVNFDKAKAEFEKLVATAGISQSKLQKILQNLSAEYTGTERKVRDSIVRMITAQSKLGGNNTATLNSALRQLGITGFNTGQQLTSGINQATTASNNLALSWQSVGRIFVGQAIFRLVSQITNQIGEATDRARELQLALAQIQTIAPPDLQIGGIGEIGKLTKTLSNDFGIDQVEAARAVYEGFSNQLGDTDATMEVLIASARLAKTTMSDFGTSSAVVASVLNAYNLNSKNAEGVTDLLFQTIKVSAAKMGEFEGAIGRVAPTAKAMGVELTELLRIFSAINIQGTDTDTAFTQTLNLMKGLLAPTKALRGEFDRLQIANANVGIAQFGLLGLLDKLKGNKTLTEFADQFDDIREKQAIFSLLGESGQAKLKSDAKAFANAAGIVKTSFEFIEKTPAQQLQKAIEQFKNVLTDDLGNAVINAINNIVKSFGGAEAAASAFSTLLKNSLVPAAILFGTTLAVGVAAATVSFVGLLAGATAVLGPIGAVVAILGGFAAAVVGVGAVNEALFGTQSAAQKVATEFEKLQPAIKAWGDASTKEAQKVNDALNAETKTAVAVAITSLGDRMAATQQIHDEAKRLEKTITVNLKEQLKERASAIESYIDKVNKNSQDSVDKIKKIGEGLRDFELNVREGRVNRNLDNAPDDQRRAQLLEQEIKRQRDAARRAQAAGNEEDSAKFLENALKYAERLAGLAGERSEAESIINSILRQRQGLAASEVASIKKGVDDAAKKVPQLEEEATKIKSLINEYEQLAKAMTEAENTGTKQAGLEQNLQNLSVKLKDALANFVKLAPKGIADDLLTQIPAEFKNIDGVSAPLDLTVDQSLKAIQAKLSQTRLTLDVELRIQNLSGVEAGPNQIKQLQSKLAELQKQSETSNNNAAPLGGLNNEISAAKQNLDSLFATLKNEAQLPKLKLLDSATFNAEFTAAIQKNSAILATEAAKFQSNIEAAVKNAVDTGDTSQINTQLEKAAGFIEANKDNPALKGVVDAVTKIQTALADLAPKTEAFKKAFDASIEAQNTQQQISALTEIIDGAKTRAELMNSALTAMAPAAAAGSNSAVTSLNAVATAANNAKAAVDALNAAQSAGSSNGSTATQTKARGGLMHFFNRGGFAPRGTDTVPAMLSPGEFVVNAKSTRRFYSELQAINAGRSPAYLADGGPVSNSFGDININLPKGTDEQHARSVVKKINRQLRRGSARIN